MTRSILVRSVLALGLCAPFMPVQAQPNGQAGKAAQKFEQVATQLALTPQQKRQLVPILVSEAPKVEAIKNDSSLTKMQKFQQLRALHDQTDPQVKAILTPEQYQKLQGIRRQELEQAIRNKAAQ
jgi:protein CpxP